MPEVPQNLVITPGPAGSHMGFIDWDNALRATSHRVIKRNVDTTPELKDIIVTESEVTVSTLTLPRQSRWWFLPALQGQRMERPGKPRHKPRPKAERDARVNQSSPTAPVNATVP
jgi:hypothetical protein